MSTYKLNCLYDDNNRSTTNVVEKVSGTIVNYLHDLAYSLNKRSTLHALLTTDMYDHIGNSVTITLWKDDELLLTVKRFNDLLRVGYGNLAVAFLPGRTTFFMPDGLLKRIETLKKVVKEGHVSGPREYSEDGCTLYAWSIDLTDK